MVGEDISNLVHSAYGSQVPKEDRATARLQLRTAVLQQQAQDIEKEIIDGFENGGAKVCYVAQKPN